MVHTGNQTRKLITSNMRNDACTIGHAYYAFLTAEEELGAK